VTVEERGEERAPSEERPPPRTRICRICSVEINAASARCPYCGARQFKHQPILGWRGALVCLIVAAAAVLVTRAIVGAGGRTTLEPYLSSNLAALLPPGYANLDRTAQHGTATAEFAPPGNPADSERIVAALGMSGTPRSRMQALETRLSRTPGVVRGALFRVVFPGGLVAYEVPYTQNHVAYASFAFDACGGTIGVTVTISASRESTLNALSLVLPQNAQPRCDGPAFSNVDRADVSVPLAPR
jgi:RNA polymerase subunit RPABC4/transcription elongation factor Spt4